MTEENVDMRALLDEEGDIAADYLEELLDITDIDGDIEITVEADRAAVGIVADDGGDRRLKRLIGKQGDTLDAIQELTRLAVQQQTGERSRLMLDILGYRQQHRQEIAEIAHEAIDRVEESGEPVALKPMNPFERKVVHDVVAEAGLFSDSSGIGAARHVVISLPDEEVDDENDVLAESTQSEDSIDAVE
ncbi:single-stranded DNA-binding protein [Arcanobacterium phocisimile]|uniref:Single-stranded DNA-binding protein n=1 Tax=Arcanobacterium phocisimile TaxID=1302235 RepID=A0ABX7IGD2_9ACTO|nr:R3H domain-containing nucleic acid-binding protein [Arcanobacterium phocisimile]QRV02181.1 single-stranded DNA-binding protein [Arcanobacterium phocisimile]